MWDLNDSNLFNFTHFIIKELSFSDKIPTLETITSLEEHIWTDKQGSPLGEKSEIGSFIKVAKELYLPSSVFSFLQWEFIQEIHF